MESQTELTSPFSFTPMGRHTWKVGDRVLARGEKMTVRYLDGTGGVVLQGAVAVNERRFKLGSKLSIKGVLFKVLGVRGIFLSLRRTA